MSIQKNEKERASFYLEQVDGSLVNHYKLIKVKESLNTFLSDDFFKREFLLHQFDSQFYYDLEPFLKKNYSHKEMAKELLVFLKKAQSDFARIHINYLLFKVYKRQLPSRSRNRNLKKYSDLCYKTLEKLYKI